MKKIYNLVKDYFDSLEGKKVILLDFDGTVVVENWPYVGKILPGCVEVLNKLLEAGHKIIFYTQRTTKFPLTSPRLEKFLEDFPYYLETDDEGKEYADIFTPARSVLIDNGIKCWDVNRNKHWEFCTADPGRKIFCDYIIDDHCVGMKYNTYTNSYGEKVNCCDWRFIDDWFVKEGLYKERVFPIQPTFYEIDE